MSILALSVYPPAEPGLASAGNLGAWSEERLVVAAKRGYSEAFGELCERNSTRIFRVANRITRNREDAEDAVQDSFLNAFVHLKDFDGRSRFTTWLTRIAINSALAKLRKRRGIREVSMDEPSPLSETHPHDELQDCAPNPEESFHQTERVEAISTAIAGLRPRIRKVVEFHHMQEHSIKETARILGITTTAAKSRMFHARTALRRMTILKCVEGPKVASAGRLR